MKHVFPFQRTIMRAVRPIANRISPVELPPDTYFGNMLDLFQKLEGIDVLLEDPQVTSVRLVTNPEKMVLRETQRAYVYFSLHGLIVDQILVNRVLPEQISDEFFGSGESRSRQRCWRWMRTSLRSNRKGFRCSRTRWLGLSGAGQPDDWVTILAASHSRLTAAQGCYDKS